MRKPTTSPSNLYRRALCPASAKLERKAIDEIGYPPSSPAAQRGTKLHALTTSLLQDKHGELDMEGLTKDDLDAVDLCCAVIHNLRSMVQDQADALGLKTVELHEQKFDLTDIGMKEGRVDYLLMIPGVAIYVYDYKFGQVHTPHPRWNYQTQSYGFGAWKRYGGANIIEGLIQPELDEEIQVRQHQFKAEELQEHGARIREVIGRTLAKNPLMIPGANQCNWCKAKDLCPARRQLAWPKKSDPITIEEKLSMLSPAELSLFYGQLDIFATWSKNAKTKLDDMVIDGTLNIPGYEIGYTTPKRKWEDEAVARTTLREIAMSKDKNPDDMEKTVLVSPSQAEKLLGKSKAVREQMEPLVVRGEGNPKVVPSK